MECPVCSEPYPLQEIEAHVETCLSLQEFEDFDAKKTKRSYPFAENSQESSKKKQKFNVDKSVPNFSKNEKTSSTNSKNEQTFNSNSKNTSNSMFEVANQGSDENKVSLAELLRPSSSDSFLGQKKLLGPDGVLRKLIKNSQLPSMILWGPPGCGKSSFIDLIVKNVRRNQQTKVVKLNAASSGIAKVREVVASAAKDLKLGGRTVLVMGQLHRFNKLQQDIFLPHVESGTFIFVGTTTENPHFSLNPALLSRCRIFEFEKLKEEETEQIVRKGISALNGSITSCPKSSVSNPNSSLTSSSLEPKFLMNDKTIQWLASSANGNAAAALGSLELAARTKISSYRSSEKQTPMLNVADLKNSLEKFYCSYNGNDDLKFQLYSALHKSVGAGHANGGLYWLARLMAMKEDPVYIAKRLIRIASEEIGLADPDALDMAVHTLQACQMIGMPECDIMLGQTVIYMARSTKSRLVEEALRRAQKTIFERKEFLGNADTKS
ncbi:ATPase WRNIP1-like [Venturia canescens]|uniref:ATPase WRNIP1-like n=1 Tax=Venturia canescens TaxID=32260 RepID=UPI001C9D42B5|nr:ATPase WRNIP1-like [Venturia canescens]